MIYEIIITQYSMDKEESYIKHKKYFSSYKPNELYWGIGIENETYLEIPNQEKVEGSFFLKNHKRERYSVDYFDGYLDSYFLKSLRTIINENDKYDLPLLINSHSLTKCDLSGNHITLYTKGSKPNPLFSGKTVIDYMKEKDSYFKDEFENSYCFDGDTVEFMTLNYYKTTINKVIDELIYEKKRFLRHLNKIPTLNNVIYPKKNHGFARFKTNPNNLAIFNNGTYHFNFTLPTMLDDKAEIKDRKRFIQNHKKAIIMIQLFEPFFIALYGSPDPLSKSTIYSYRFPNGSQRVAASRYIGAGTYDTHIMTPGKLLQEDRKTITNDKPTFFWYKKLYQQIHYKMNDKIGFDINFNKFLNHGIEIRFLDWFDESLLPGLLEAFVYILDHSQALLPVQTPIRSPLWNDMMYRAILEGSSFTIRPKELSYLEQFLNIKIKLKSLKADLVFKDIIRILKSTYNYKGPCSKYMLEQPIMNNISCCGLKL